MNKPGRQARQIHCDAEEAMASIANGTTVAVGHVGAEPTTLTKELWKQAPRLRDVTLLSGLMMTGYPFLQKPDGPFRLKTWFMPGTLISGDMRDVNADFLPMDWTQVARFLMSGVIDTAIVQVSEPDHEGFHSLGIASSHHWHMAMGAKRIIAEVNGRMPYVPGDAKLHTSEIDVLVRADHDLLAFPNRQPGETEYAVGRQAAAFVRDGSTIQFGIGSIPGAVLGELVGQGRKDLHILSLLTDPARVLIEAGCCAETGPKALVAEIMGSLDLYAWAHNNTDLYATRALRTHALEAFVHRKDVVSINSALEIDLFGQANTEWLNGRQLGAIGGAMDFSIAAQFEGNLSIIALNSATNKGRSRIVPLLATGPVTIPRSLVQIVVTEHGAADLRNKTVHERALALAAIAHPNHRENLERAARGMK